MSIPAPPIGRFRPFSNDDFSVRAKHAAWLLRTPLQATQEWLAVAYGYSGLHELKQDLKKRASDTVQYPAGPTDEYLDRQVTDSILSGELISAESNGYMVGARRSNALLASAASLKRYATVRELSIRERKIVDLGLFNEPANHRSMFGAVKMRCEILEFDGPPPSPHHDLPGDYAYLDTDSQGLAILSFTALGRAVFGALEDVCIGSDRKDVDEYLPDLTHLLYRYPANPWVKATYALVLVTPYWQDRWAYNIPRTLDGYLPDSADPRYKKHGASFALELLPIAEEAIALFGDLYGEQSKNIAHHKLVGAGGEHGADTLTYPSILYDGGMIALGAGNLSLAKRWLTHSRKVVANDNFGSRYPLSVISLLQGKGSASGYFKYKRDPTYQDSWLDFVLIAEHLQDGNLGLAREVLIRVLIASPHALRAIDSRYRDTDACWLSSNYQHIVHFEEFFFRTAPFWKRHPGFLKRLRKWTSPNELRSAYKTMHLAQNAARGIALKPRKEGMELTKSKESAVDCFKVIAAALMSVD